MFVEILDHLNDGMGVSIVPSNAEVTIRYKLYPSAVIAELYALALTTVALVIAAVSRGDVDTTFAATILIPTTVVAGFIGACGSVLVSAFLQRYRLALLVSNIALWIWVLWLVRENMEGSWWRNEQARNIARAPWSTAHRCRTLARDCGRSATRRPEDSQA